MSIRTYLTALVALLSVANGHMIMKTPTPYGKSSLNNSPLVADGSDFPCKQRSGVYDAEGAANVMPIGAPQTLSFTGSAVHGGGSCQVSLTTDKAPTKDSTWMVIHSIQGGCPANVDGNLPANPDGSGASTFQFSVPSGIAPGEYTLGWTWFNRIGNREMYMNCAPVTVTGAKRKRTAEPQPRPGFTKRADFPAMFVANIGNGCSTADSTDLTFPNPGSSVQQIAGNTFAPPVGTCQAATGGSSGSSSSPSGSSSAAPAAASSAAPVASDAPASQASTSATPTVSPGVFATGPASSSGSAPAVATSAAAPAPVASAAPSAAAPPSTSGASGTQSGACTNEGYWNCVGGSSFQRCASGQWSIAMQMAAGTTCTPGVSAELTMTKRALRFYQPHVRRHINTWGQ